MKESDLQELKEKVRGAILCQDDEGYDAARIVWNGMIDKKPELIVRCTGVADVIDSVNFARTQNLVVAIRGGGHNVAGNAVCDGGIMIDLSLMNGVRVDPDARTAWVQGGAILGDLDRETQAFGLAAPVGVVSETGVAGLTLGGGTGWLSGKYGLSIDNLLSIDVVTADGRFLKASDNENDDLFWALKGGGGNFGVATSFEFKLHPVGPMVTQCSVMYPAEEAKDVLRSWREFTPTAPDELTSIAILWHIPALPIFPETLHGKSAIIIFGIYIGPQEKGEEVIRPLREFGTLLVDQSGPIPFRSVQTTFDPFFTPNGKYLCYWKSLDLNSLEDEVIDKILTIHANRTPMLPQSLIVIQDMSGEYSRIHEEATAYGDRSSPYLLELNTTWTDPSVSEINVNWTRNAWDEMHRFSTGGMYLNHPGFGEEGEELVKKSYGKNYDRLVSIKNKYDPDNLFRLNQNIKPTSSNKVR